MKLSVGYQPRTDSSLVDAVLENRDLINEIYFSFGDIPNGRSTSGIMGELNHLDAAKKQQEDFMLLRDSGISFNLLLNANCYGSNAQSRAFFCEIGETAEYLLKHYGLSYVTTTSPLIAKFIKQNFPEIKTRASVNIGIETADSMDYISEWFDGFYAKREYNRDIKQLAVLKGWCDKNQKELYGLANSGCLNFCSAHTFHDNLVAHENEISHMDNAYSFEGQCFTYLSNEKKREEYLRITNFIRPEEVELYKPYFSSLKLATRVIKNPAAVIRAYCGGSFNGAVTSLLEPDHSGLFYPFVIDNKSLPSDFTETTAKCDKSCDKCGYCQSALSNALVGLV